MVYVQCSAAIRPNIDRPILLYIYTRRCSGESESMGYGVWGYEATVTGQREGEKEEEDRKRDRTRDRKRRNRERERKRRNRERERET